MIHDYFRTRLEMDMSSYPDKMVFDTARDVELRCFEAGIRVGDIAYLIEAAKRNEPKVHSATISEGVRPKEGIG